MRKYNFSFQKFLKNILLVVAVVTVFASVVYAKKPQPQPVSNLVVIDANGNKVGNVISILSTEPGFSPATGENFATAFVALSIDNHPTIFLIRSDGFVQGSGGLGGGPYFTSSDCSGTAYIQVGSNAPIGGTFDSLFPVDAIGTPGHTVYIPASGGVFQLIDVKASLLSSGQCVPFLIGTVSAIPVQPLINLDTEFTSPFSLREEKGQGGKP